MSGTEAAAARQRLIEGNGRFATGNSTHRKADMRELKALAENGQRPFALIVCCSDSRVPPELVFDQGLGQLFVVRTAGNVLDEVGLGSVEYGAEHLHIPLIVVLGHEGCGAVRAAVDGGEARGALGAVVGKIRPLLRKPAGPAGVYEECAEANIRNTVAEISGNAVVARLIAEGKTEVVGAKYLLRSGEVVFLQA